MKNKIIFLGMNKTEVGLAIFVILSCICFVVGLFGMNLEGPNMLQANGWGLIPMLLGTPGTLFAMIYNPE